MVAVLPSGTKLTPARLTLVARKTGDETVNNSATLQNDDALFLPVVANAKYRFEMQVRFSSLAVADFKWSFTLPASATLNYSALHVPVGGTAPLFADFVNNAVGTAEGGSTYIRMLGGFDVAGSAGTLQFQWAQATANASDTLVQNFSFMNLQRYV